MISTGNFVNSIMLSSPKKFEEEIIYIGRRTQGQMK